MKALIYRVSLVAASVMLLSIPAQSEEGTVYGSGDMGMSATKNECLLVAKNCVSDSIQVRIEKITTEIKRGTSVYTPEELKSLNRQLDGYNNLLLHLERDDIAPGAGV
jgi:hypothetical protein